MSTENTLTVTDAESPSLHANLTKVVEKHPMTGRHSYFQLKYFIVNKEPTIQAKLWQCLREMKARKETLDGLELERAELLDQIELSEIALSRPDANASAYGIDTPDDEWSQRERAISKRQGERRLASLKKGLDGLEVRQRETEEEAAFFLQAFTDLEKVEKAKPYDDVEAQKAYWSARFSNEMNMKLMLEHRIDPELAKAVLSLPDDVGVKRELVGVLNRQQQAIEIEQRKQQALVAAQGENG